MVSTATNALFVIFAVSNPATVEARLANLAPWLSLKVGDGQWLLIAPGATTTKEISDRLGITGDESISNAIIVRSDGYFGRSAASHWEWISTKLGASLGTASV